MGRRRGRGRYEPVERGQGGRNEREEPRRDRGSPRSKRKRSEEDGRKDTGDLRRRLGNNNNNNNNNKEEAREQQRDRREKDGNERPSRRERSRSRSPVRGRGRGEAARKSVAKPSREGRRGRQGEAEPPKPAGLTAEQRLRQGFGVHLLEEVRGLLSRHLLSNTSRLGDELYGKYQAFMGWKENPKGLASLNVEKSGKPLLQLEKGEPAKEGGGKDREESTLKVVSNCIEVLTS
ncbi:hypothetical protein HOP50_04g30000 [Chloropicon primus]|nr:hypothetical protein HOP50_04g30000 [Chloropicon primus]